MNYIIDAKLYFMKRILIIMQSLGGGGAEKVLVDILRNFDTNSFKIDLCLINQDNVYLDAVPKYIKILPYYKKSLIRNITSKIYRKLKLKKKYYLTEKIYFRRYIKDNYYDIVISFMEGESLMYHSFIFDKCSKNISWVHTNLRLNHWSSVYFKNNKEEEEAYRSLYHIVFVSEDAKLEFSKIFKVEDVRKKVIYNLIDKREIILKAKGGDIKKRQFTICCVGRLIEAKRFDRAIDIVYILRQKKIYVDLWILGTGKLEGILKKQVESLNLTDCVTFWGFITNPYPIMQCSDLFLITSETEGYSLVLSEALCLGLPIVSTNISGVRETLENGKYGILTNFNNYDIANSLGTLILDKSELDNLSHLSQKRSNIFQAEYVMSEIYNLLKS